MDLMDNLDPCHSQAQVPPRGSDPLSIDAWDRKQLEQFEGTGLHQKNKATEDFVSEIVEEYGAVWSEDCGPASNIMDVLDPLQDGDNQEGGGPAWRWLRSSRFCPPAGSLARD
jgi:hypothetical protein